MINNFFDRIDDEYWYNIKQIFDNNFFFFYRDYGGVYRTVVKDYMDNNKLGTIVVKNKIRNMYKIKGSNIRKYIEGMMNRTI